MQFEPTRAAGLAQLEQFLPRAGRAYASTRNHDHGGTAPRRNVSQLSPWLHSGLLSEAEVLDAVLKAHSPSAAEKFVSEVFWRVYFKGYLEQRPTIWPAYTEARDNALAAADQNAGVRTAYTQAVEGRTGIAAFDHWARELTRTGYLHNHARMWFASIWIFTLKLDWTLGADFFLRHLIDADAASNTLSWRWIAGLHTKGKTYLARPDNIARYTADHPEGPLRADGLAGEAFALEEAREHVRQPLNLPQSFALPDAPYALLLHDEGAHYAPLDLQRPPVLVVGAARTQERSPAGCGALAGEFADAAIKHALAEASAEFGCPASHWEADGAPLSDLLAQAGVEHIVTPFLPQGWTRDSLWPQLAPLDADGQLTQHLPELQRLAFPYAKAGFFGVKKQMEKVLRECGIPRPDQFELGV